MELRKYQKEAMEAIRTGWSQFRRQLLVLPTGTGKTIVFSHLAKQEAEAGKRVMVLAHRSELLEQAQNQLLQAAGLHSSLEKASSQAHDSLLPVIVASVQTLSDKRLQRWDPNTIDLIIIDEAHHCLADSYQRILDHFGNSRVLGVTATPDRGDKKALADIFENIAYEYPFRTAIKEEFLCPISARLLPISVDLGNVRVTAGDYNPKDIDVGIRPHLEAVADAVAEHGWKRKSLIFLPLIATSELFTRLLCDRGIGALHIDGKSKDRAEILEWFHRMDGGSALCNSSLLLEGYDQPDIDCIVCLRPTKVRSLYAQIVGRGTRISPGKENLLILDFLWQTTRHDLCVPASLVAKDIKEAQEIMEKFTVEDGEVDLLDAERDAKADREQALAKALAASERRKKRVINPLEWSLCLHDDALMEYVPLMAWEKAPASEKQLSAIRKFGIDATMVTCKGHASMIIDRLFARAKQKLATVKQVIFLRKLGVDGSLLTMKEASVRIDEVINKPKPPPTFGGAT